MSIIDGIIKPTLDTDIDMSNKTVNTYNINVHVNNLIITDEELKAQIAASLVTSLAQQNTTPTTPTPCPDSNSSEK